MRDPGPIDLRAPQPGNHDRWREPEPAKTAPRRNVRRAAGLALGYGVAGLFTVGAAVVLVSTFSQPSDDGATETAAVIEQAGEALARADLPASAEGGPVDMGAARSITIPEPQPEPEPTAEDTAATDPIKTGGKGSVPDSSDPRWANAFAGKSAVEKKADKLPEAALAIVAERRQSGAVKAFSSIIADEPDPELPVAVKAAPTPAPDEIRTAALDPEAARAKPEAKREEPAATAEPAQTTGRAPTSTRTVRTAVNMRTGPGKSHRVVGVAPQGASVGVVSCDSWCEIVHQGKRGFVYASFLGQPRQSAEAPAGQPAPEKAEPEAKPVEDPFNAPKRSP
ncbi:MAG: SH3 domain-containing protein [Rhizobiaceae bacterium]|nr:SH3 domain-containing protein [Rhizobiaceae bacterium]